MDVRSSSKIFLLIFTFFLSSLIKKKDGNPRINEFSSKKHSWDAKKQRLKRIIRRKMLPPFCSHAILLSFFFFFSYYAIRYQEWQMRVGDGKKGKPMGKRTRWSGGSRRERKREEEYCVNEAVEERKGETKRDGEFKKEAQAVGGEIEGQASENRLKVVC